MKKKCNTGRHQSDVEDTKQVHEGDSHPTYMPPREGLGIRQTYNPNPEGDDKHYAIKVPDGWIRTQIRFAQQRLSCH